MNYVRSTTNLLVIAPNEGTIFPTESQFFEERIYEIFVLPQFFHCYQQGFWQAVKLSSYHFQQQRSRREKLSIISTKFGICKLCGMVCVRLSDERQA
jgi:hypothetical protein